MPTDPCRVLWEEVGRRSDTLLSKEEITFLSLRNVEDKWAAAEPHQKSSIVDYAADLVRDLRAAGLGGPGRKSRQEVVSDPATTRSQTDARWPLWRELMARRLPATEAPWEPLTFTLVYDTSAFPVRNQRVVISFDYRLSRQALGTELRNIWPRLQDGKWLRPGKPINADAAKIVHFNCLEVEPGTPWRERLDEWKRQAPPNHRYADHRAFHSEFKRAEERLTGSKYGLAWFYEDIVRSGRLRNLERDPELLKTGKRVIEMYRELYDHSFQQPDGWYEQVERESRPFDSSMGNWRTEEDLR